MTAKQPFNPDRLRAQLQAEAQFVAALASYQAGNGRNDIAFARVMGVSDALWRHTKAGRVPLGWKLLMAGRGFVSYDTVVAAEASLKTRAQNRQSGGRGTA